MPTFNIYTVAVAFSPDENTLFFQVFHVLGMSESHTEQHTLVFKIVLNNHTCYGLTSSRKWLSWLCLVVEVPASSSNVIFWAVWLYHMYEVLPEDRFTTHTFLVFSNFNKRSSRVIVLLSHYFSIQSPPQLRNLYHGESCSVTCGQKSLSCVISCCITTISTPQSSWNFWQPIWRQIPLP